MCRVDEGDEEIKTLADVSVGLMFDVIEPLGEILTTLPVGPDTRAVRPGRASSSSTSPTTYSRTGEPPGCSWASISATRRRSRRALGRETSDSPP